MACGGGPDCGGGECQACVVSNPFDCTGDTICLDDVCQPAFGRSYVFTVTTATLPSADAMGASWDEAGGLPDPFVELIINVLTLSLGAVVMIWAWAQRRRLLSLAGF